jgi:hypothetical protein
MGLGKVWWVSTPRHYRNVSQLGSRIESILIHLVVYGVLESLAVANIHDAKKEYDYYQWRREAGAQAPAGKDRASAVPRWTKWAKIIRESKRCSFKILEPQLCPGSRKILAPPLIWPITIYVHG